MNQKIEKYNLIIDGTPLLSALTGIGKYTNEISKYLEKDNFLDVSYFYGYYSKKRIEPAEGSSAKSLKAFVSSIPLLKKISRKLLIFVSEVLAPKYDLYWSPNFIPLDGIKASKIVTTVHDFSFYLHPQWHPAERLDYFNKYFFKNIKKADWIITGSEFTKQEIIK